MTNLKKLSIKKVAIIAGAAAVLAGCSLTGNGSVSTTGGNTGASAPTAMPTSAGTTGAAPSGSTMGSGSYQLQGTTQGGAPQGQVQGATDDQTLNKDLGNINTSQDLNAVVK